MGERKNCETKESRNIEMVKETKNETEERSNRKMEECKNCKTEERRNTEMVKHTKSETEERKN